MRAGWSLHNDQRPEIGLGMLMAAANFDPKKIDARYARLKGADESFLASLPEFRGY